MATYTYANLKSKYDNFHHPVIVLKVNGKDFAKNKAGLVVSDIEVELTSGFEASIASFMIYNTFDTDNSCYRINDIKAYIMLGLLWRSRWDMKKKRRSFSAAIFPE